MLSKNPLYPLTLGGNKKFWRRSKWTLWSKLQSLAICNLRPTCYEFAHKVKNVNWFDLRLRSSDGPRFLTGSPRLSLQIGDCLVNLTPSAHITVMMDHMLVLCNVPAHSELLSQTVWGSDSGWSCLCIDRCLHGFHLLQQATKTLSSRLTLGDQTWHRSHILLKSLQPVCGIINQDVSLSSASGCSGTQIIPLKYFVHTAIYQNIS